MAHETMLLKIYFGTELERKNINPNTFSSICSLKDKITKIHFCPEVNNENKKDLEGYSISPHNIIQITNRYVINFNLNLYYSCFIPAKPC